MNKRLEKKIKTDEEEIIELENSLYETLRLIPPPDDMMLRLKKRLGSLEPHRIAKRISNWELSIIIIGSVVSTAMVILTITRALFYFFGRHKRNMV